MFKHHLTGLALSGIFAEAEGQTSSGGSAASAKKPPFCAKDYDLDTGEFTFEFGNGKTVSCKIEDFNEEIRTRAMYHGFSQKIGDSYASAKGDYSKGIDAAQSVIDALKDGDWNQGRETEGKPRIAELSAALARVKGIPEEEALAAVTKAAALDGDEEAKKAGQEKLKAWRAHPKVKAAILQIAAEKAAAKAAESEQQDDPKLD